jgi:hypothetical protein
VTADERHDDVAADDDDLPARDDPYWAELTADTLAHLRRLRAAERRRRLGGAAYTAYVILVVALVYVVPYVWYALVQPDDGGPARTPPAVTLGAVGVVGFVLVGFVRDGSWRGPAVLDRPTTAWLLPAPLVRRALLVPRWRTALAVSAVAGTVAGLVAAVMLRVAAGGPAGRVATAGAIAGLLVAVLGASAGLLVEAVEEGRPGRRGGGQALWLGPVLVLAAATLAAVAPQASPGIGDWLPTVALWSGPWGWAVQPLVAALPGTAPAGVESLWPAGLGLAAALASSAVVRADRAVDRIGARTLRTRADSVSLVGASITMLQPRRARLTVLAAQGHAPSTRLRLRPPRWRILLGPWRDVTALLRAPSRLLWAVVWLAVALALLAAALGPAGAPGDVAQQGSATAQRVAVGERLLLGVPGLVALYLAAAQLVEAARLDADDPRRLRIRPTAATRQALGHAVVAIAALGAALLAALVAGLPEQAGMTALAALPALVGAALVSAYRGDAPLSLVAGGGSSPMGDVGPGALLAWYVRAPLVVVVLLLPRLLGWSIAGTLAPITMVVMLMWAASRAEAVLRS